MVEDRRRSRATNERIKVMIERVAVGIELQRLLDYLPAADYSCLTEQVSRRRIYAAIFAMPAKTCLCGGGKKYSFIKIALVTTVL